MEGSPYLVAADAAEEVLAKSSSGGTSEPRSDASKYLLNLFIWVPLLAWFRYIFGLFAFPYFPSLVHKWHFREENAYSKL